MSTLRQSLLRLAVVSFAVLAAACGSGEESHEATSAEPWGRNTVTPAALMQELDSPSRPVIVCTAPDFLYRQARIPGAVHHGPATSPAALQSLSAWAGALDRGTKLVIYCGCCPMRDCPNLRPAYNVLKGLGFTQVRILVLPTSFGTDWMGAGGPIERGDARSQGN